ncbi:MAG: hypothetical protein GY719_40605 [bacterium]|nr:hypothetical protein [bacterium]
MRNALSMFSILLVSAFAGGLSAADAPPPMPLPQVWAGTLEAPPDNVKLGARDIEIKIRALSSDKEVQALHLELRLGGQKRLREAMFRLEQKAWVRLGKAAATSVGLVRVFDLPDGRRRMRLVSDYPARLLDSSDTVTSEHPFAFVELIVDRDGTAEGQMVAAASIAFAEGGVLIESAGAPPYRIIDVRTDSPPR